MCLAVPGKIISVSDAVGMERTGKVDFGGVQREVSLACVPEAQIGEYVIVHVGFALETISEDEAAEVFRYLDSMGELAELKAAS